MQKSSIRNVRQSQKYASDFALEPKLPSYRNQPIYLRLATFFKKRLWHRCFPMNFAKFLRPSFLTEHLLTTASRVLLWYFISFSEIHAISLKNVTDIFVLKYLPTICTSCKAKVRSLNVTIHLIRGNYFAILYRSSDFYW